MNKEQAISVIEQALNLASNKGVFNLKDASIIFSAFTIVNEYLTLPTESVIMNKYSEVTNNKQEVVKDKFKEIAYETGVVTSESKSKK